MTIRLQELNDSNWRECAALQLADEEKAFIASNVYTIAEWKFEADSIIKAIYFNNTLIGMLAYYLHDGQHGYFYWLYHLMIQKEHQGKGYGEAAVKLAIKEMQELGATDIRTMTMPGNIRPQNLYQKLGFKQIGTLDGGDLFFRLQTK